jgi:hypothetical protein
VRVLGGGLSEIVCTCPVCVTAFAYVASDINREAARSLASAARPLSANSGEIAWVDCPHCGNRIKVTPGSQTDSPTG